MRGGLRDERGGIMVIAALAMIPITMLAFAAVEFHNYGTQRSELQDAVDAAALAVARAPSGLTQAQLRTLYTGVLRSQLRLKPGLITLVEAQPDPVTGAGGQPELTFTGGKVVASASLAISPIIASFFVDKDLIVSGGAEVLREAKGLEVALVLDNTGSMQTNNRIGIARTAATNFVLELEKVTTNSTAPNAVKIGVVPFAATVNVGPSYSGQAWLDPSAQSPVHNQLFTTARGQAVATNRWTLLSDMQIPWGGCVESRPMPYDIQDTAPSAATPATLFVPYFYPDESDHIPVASNTSDPIFHARFWGWSSLNPSGIQPYAPSNQWIRDLIPAFQGYNWHPTDRTLGGLWPDFQIRAKPGHVSNQEDRDGVYDDFRLHVNGDWLAPQKAREKYNLTAVNAEVAAGRFNKASRDQGPNKSCKLPALTRLTSTTSVVKTAISAMTAEARNTNVPMGLMWGWHLLSPNAPFSDGAPYGARGGTKIIVLMTDGENSIAGASNLNGAEYSGIGYPWQNRVGTTNPSQVAGALNGRLAALCTNVKNAGIVLYTVRVEVTGPNTVLQACATTPAMAYDVTQASQLDATFKEIARSIQNLRLSA